MYYNTCYTSLFLNKNGSPLMCFHPKTQYLLLKVKDFEIFYPHARGLASLLLGHCPTLMMVPNIAKGLYQKLMLNSFSKATIIIPWKCYPTSTFAAYYPHPKHDLTKGLYLLPNIPCVTSISIPIGS